MLALCKNEQRYPAEHQDFGIICGWNSCDWIFLNTEAFMEIPANVKLRKQVIEWVERDTRWELGWIDVGRYFPKHRMMNGIII